ncbi:MAG: PilZ domain-containing protein [Polyangiaceae bacterium]
MEHRISPRSKTNVSLTVQRGRSTFRARCVELSQTGMLVLAPKAFRDSAWPYLSAKLALPSGVVSVLARRVGLRGDKVAYAFVVLDEASEARLTDFLFEQVTSRRRAA